MGSGFGSVGRALTSNSRGLRFESSKHWQIGKHTVNCIEKTKIEKKGPGMAHLKKTQPYLYRK